MAWNSYVTGFGDPLFIGPKIKTVKFIHLSPEDGRQRFFETLASTDRSKRRFNPDHNHSCHRRENIKSHALDLSFCLKSCVLFGCMAKWARFISFPNPMFWSAVWCHAVRPTAVGRSPVSCWSGMADWRWRVRSPLSCNQPCVVLMTQIPFVQSRTFLYVRLLQSAALLLHTQCIYIADGSVSWLFCLRRRQILLLRSCRYFW